MDQALASIAKAGVKLQSQSRDGLSQGRMGKGRLATIRLGSLGNREVTGKQTGRQKGAELVATLVGKNTGIEGRSRFTSWPWPFEPWYSYL